MSKRYDFIKIEHVDGVDMAYLLDNDRGVVILAPVEMMGEELSPAPRRRLVPAMTYRGSDEEEIEVPRRPAPRRVVQTLDEERNLAPHDIAPAQPEQPTRPMPRAKSIVPPHLRGVFLKPGKPGADVERRDM